MISTDDFHAIVQRAIGSRMMTVGQKYSGMVHSERRFIHLKYDEVETFEEVAKVDDIDIHDGQEWITIFAYDKNGNAPDYGR